MKKDKKVFISMLITTIISVVIIGSVIFYMGLQPRFSKFLINVNNSTIDSIDKQIKVTYHDDSYLLNDDNSYSLYSWLIVAGPGRDRLFIPKNIDDEISINYADGSLLVLASKKDKLYVSYTKDDYKHIFVTKDIKFQRFYDSILNKNINIIN